jgi:hypothetical protein
MHHPPHEKRTLKKYTKNLEALRTSANCHDAERYEEEGLNKAGVGANCPRVQR